MKPFVIKETPDGVEYSRSPVTDAESCQLKTALRRCVAKKIGGMTKIAVENGYVETITYRELKKAIRQVKKKNVSSDGFYMQLITKDGLKIYGPGTPEQIMQEWQKDIKGENET